MNTTRIRKQAEDMGIFDEIKCMTEQDIPEYIQKHADFIHNNPPGYGKFIWKSKIVYDTLLSMRDGEYLIYADAGMYLNKAGMSRFSEYMDMIRASNITCLTFATNGYFSDCFANPDAVATYFPNFYNQMYKYCYAGIFILKKTPDTVNMIRDWYTLCQNYTYLLGYSVKRYIRYVGGDSDNGLFNLCLAKHADGIYRVFPDETNIYMDDNISQNLGGRDWSSLAQYPFQCRRIRPSRDGIYTEYEKEKHS